MKQPIITYIPLSTKRRKAKRGIAKHGLSRSAYKTIAFLVFLMALVSIAGYQVKANEPRTFVSPLAISPEIYTKPQDRIPETKEQIIYASKHGDIIYRIWTLESSRGKQPFQQCQSKRMTNEFGFGVLSGVCFKTFGEAVTTIDHWLDTHLAEYNLATAMCIYNIGQAISDCDYAKKFTSI